MKKLLLILLIAIGGYLLYQNWYVPNYVVEEDLSEGSLRLRQKEAKEMLRDAYQKQESYYKQRNHYTWWFDSLEMSPRGTYYELEIMENQATYFSIRAEGNIDDDDTEDVWTITVDGKPRNLVDDVKN